MDHFRIVMLISEMIPSIRGVVIILSEDEREINVEYWNRRDQVSYSVSDPVNRNFEERMKKLVKKRNATIAKLVDSVERMNDVITSYLGLLNEAVMNKD